MKRKLFPILIFLLAGTAAAVSAQERALPVGNPPEARDDRRPNLLAELGLSAEQVQLIRRINAERRPRMQAAQKRLFEANRALDAAIYADAVDEGEVQMRLKEFQAAQGEVARLRFNSELAVRTVLTPEQLFRFRELRARFAEAGGDFRQNRRRRQRPNMRPINRQVKPLLND